MITWRLIAIIVLLTLSVLDLSFTFYYVHEYKKWQPDKPYKLIELNPLLVFLWNNFGLNIGMIIGSVILLALNFIVAKEAHWAIVLILFLFMLFAMFNHTKNITLLHQLIEKYPSGYLPVETFGNVIGNNTKL
jgi:uncharacterized protein YacL